MGPRANHCAELKIRRAVLVDLTALCVNLHRFQEPENYSIARKEVPENKVHCSHWRSLFQVTKITHICHPVLILMGISLLTCQQALLISGDFINEKTVSNSGL